MQNRREKKCIASITSLPCSYDLRNLTLNRNSAEFRCNGSHLQLNTQCGKSFLQQDMTQLIKTINNQNKCTSITLPAEISHAK